MSGIFERGPIDSAAGNDAGLDSALRTSHQRLEELEEKHTKGELDSHQMVELVELRRKLKPQG